MSARRARVADWKAVSEIRRLQSRAAEMEAVRAGTDRGAAAERHVEAEESLDDAQSGWTAALEGVFDPGLAGQWFAEIGRKEAGEREAREALGKADRRLEEKRGDWHAAEARAEAAGARLHGASAGAARRREEARLAEVEDRFARPGRR